MSSAGAREIMQILPGPGRGSSTAWTRAPLVPASATDNVRGASLILRWLRRLTGGNPAMAAAGYYQGLPSVERLWRAGEHAELLNSVMDPQQRFGGG